MAMLTEEAELVPGTPAPAAIKMMHFVKAAEGVDPAALRAHWQDPQTATAGLRRAVHSYRLPAGDPILAHFGASAMPRYDGVASL